MFVLALGVSAAGGSDDDDLTFRFRDETAPAGGMVQMKVEDTDGTPISGGRPRVRLRRRPCSTPSPASACSRRPAKRPAPP